MDDFRYVNSAQKEIFGFLCKLSISPTVKNVLYPTGRFVLGVYKGKIGFWEEGCETKRQTWISEKSFLVSTPDRTTTISSIDGSFRLDEHIGSDSIFPRMDFGWIEEENEWILEHARVIYYESCFVFYLRSKKGFLLSNPRKINLQSYGLPKKLEEAMDICGEPIRKKIDLREKFEEIMRDSMLKEFLVELRSLALKNNRPMSCRL